jgi:hypothetical protein
MLGGVFRGEGRFPECYALALLLQAAILVVFVFIAGLARATHPAFDARAVLLCLAMGVQK